MGQESTEFSIIEENNQVTVLHSRERDRILTEIAIEKERLKPQEVNSESKAEVAFAEGQRDVNEDKEDEEYQIEHRTNVFFQEQET